MNIKFSNLLLIIFISCNPNKSDNNNLSKEDILDYKDKFYEKYILDVQSKRKEEMVNKKLKF